MSSVSVIIPVYNRTDYLTETIESVIHQTYRDFKIIIVDDGSKVDLKKILDPYIAGGKVRYIYQNNKGLAGARNTGIRHSTGQYIAFLDDDDLFEPEKLEKQVLILDNNPDVGLVYSDCYEFHNSDLDNRVLGRAIGRDDIQRDFRHVFFLHPNIRVPTVLIRRECIQDVGYFDESLHQHEDGDLFLRIALKWEVFFSDYPSASVRTHSYNMSRNRIEMNESIIQSSEKIVNNNPEFRNALGSDINYRFSRLYFELGKAYLKNFKIKKSFKAFVSGLRYTTTFCRIFGNPPGKLYLK